MHFSFPKLSVAYISVKYKSGFNAESSLIYDVVQALARYPCLSLNDELIPKILKTECKKTC